MRVGVGVSATRHRAPQRPVQPRVLLEGSGLGSSLGLGLGSSLGSSLGLGLGLGSGLGSRLGLG